MQQTIGIVLAGGKDENINSNKSKLVQKINGKEIIKRAVENVRKAGIEEIATIVGYKKEEIQEVLKDTVTYIEQPETLGSGHAVMQAKEYLSGKSGKVLVINGDVPIIRPETIKNLLEKACDNSATILTAIHSTPNEYGRVVRDEFGNLKEIIEDIDLQEDTRKIQEINAGVYCFDIEKLVETLDKLQPNQKTGEYNITDIIKIMANENLKLGAVITDDNTEVLKVNNMVQLELLTRILRMRINTAHMINGVVIEDANSTHIYDDVIIGKDTVIHPNTIIRSDVVIGENCELGPNAYIREGCRLANKVKIGGFVEIKKAIIGEGTKVPHLSYMGDCEIGAKTNIGCGTITCNYDGFNKSKTIIGDHSFIGSNTNLVAPVTLGNNTFIAAGSTITEDVPDDALAIARERQTNKEGWNKK